MAVLRLVRFRGRRLRRPRRDRSARPVAADRLFGLLVATLVVSACDSPDPDYFPDDVLRTELGLTDADRVHTILLTGGEVERAEPALDTVPVGAWVQFVSGDWLVHEVAFESALLSGPIEAFLADSDQLASPPLLRRDARFVVSLEGAPPGRYPYVMAGNGAPGRGLIVVVAPGSD